LKKRDSLESWARNARLVQKVQVVRNLRPKTS
jgi:hypothetical protein